MKSQKLVFGFMTLGVLNACGGDDPPPKVPTADAPPAAEAAPAGATSAGGKQDEGSSGQVNISPDIRAACGITETEAFFAFNSAAVRKGDFPSLDKLAVCFTSGPLAGKNMRLVGHADPRGDDEYNLVLGERRAKGVKTYLVNAGLKDQQGQVTSRGELDASGTDEASWARDRRVDIVMGN